MAMDAKTLITVYNKRGRAYYATLRNGEQLMWLPAKDGIEDSQDLEFRDVQYLHSRTSTFTEGYLYVDDADVRKRLGLERDEVKANQLSREEIIGLLKGKLADMKKGFEGVSNRALIREILEVAKEVKVDSTSKLKVLSELSGVPVDVIMVEDDNTKE